MPVLLKYALTDGAIVGLWEANPPDMLVAQQTEDPGYGYVQTAGETFPFALIADYYVEGGVVTPKQRLIITANPTPFPADGVTRCQLSVTPFVPCTLLVNDTAADLTEADPVLELTSDVPQAFQVTLHPMAAATAAPLFITADAVPVTTQEDADAPAPA